MSRPLVLVVLAAVAMTAATGGLSQTLLKNQNTPYPTAWPSPLEGDPTREVRITSIVWPPGAGNNFHTHNGDQWGLVQEGEMTFTIKGQEPRVLKAGDSVYIPRGTIHRNMNLSDKAARTVEVMIVDKGKPLTVPAE